MFIAVDTETHPFGPGNRVPRLVCVQSKVEGRRPEIMLRDEGLDWFERMLSTESVSFTFVNAPYDLAVLGQARPSLLPAIFKAYEDERVHDVSTRQKLIDIAMGEYRYRRSKGYGMAQLAKRLLGRDVAKGEDTFRLRYNELDGVPLSSWPEEAITYALDDAVTTLDLHLAQEQGVGEQDAEAVLRDQYRQCRADFALYLASAWGMITDPVGCASLRAECERVIQEYEDQLEKVGFLSIKTLTRGKNKGERRVTKKRKPVQERMLAACGWDSVKLGPKGKKAKSEGDEWQKLEYISIDKEACADSGDPDLEDYSLYAQTSTFLTGPVTAYEKGSVEPIHTRFEVLLDTGRTSSSKPNIQNIARKEGAREVFVPRPGNCFIGIDVDRAELHTLAQVCYWKFGRSVLGEALNAGFDPHTGLGATLANCSYDELKQRLAAQDMGAAEMRSWAKPANFGLPGGMGAKGFRAYAKFQYGLVLSLEQCEQIIAGWKHQWPVVSGAYLEWIRQLCETGPYGNDKALVEHFRSGRFRGQVPYCAAANGFFQGLSADAIKDALFQISKRCYVNHGTALYGCRVVNEVHDEIILEAPVEKASEAAYEARDLLVERYNTWTPDFPVNSTPVLMDRWSKKAKHLTDENGRLIVWKWGSR